MPDRHTALVDENGLVDWLVEAKPGDRIVYYRGHLAYDRTPSAHVLDGPSRLIVPVVANRVMALAEKGTVLPVQQRIGSSDYLYIVVKAQSRRVVDRRLEISPPPMSEDVPAAIPAQPAPLAA
jgi:hypothetical protein